MILNITRDGFRLDNTEGFSPVQIANMNDELEHRLQVQGIDPEDSDQYYQSVKNISEKIFQEQDNE